MKAATVMILSTSSRVCVAASLVPAKITALVQTSKVVRDHDEPQKAAMEIGHAVDVCQLEGGFDGLALVIEVEQPARGELEVGDQHRQFAVDLAEHGARTHEGRAFDDSNLGSVTLPFDRLLAEQLVVPIEHNTNRAPSIEAAVLDLSGN